MYKCPSCGEKTISGMTKFMLGPARTVTCEKCKAKVSVSWWTWILFASILVCIIGIDSFIGDINTLIITIVSMIVFLYIHMTFLPLVTRNTQSE